MLFPTEYEMQEYRQELLRQAEQYRLARQAQAPSISLMQRAGQSLLKFGAKLAANHTDECTTLTSGDQVVTVCTA